MKNKGIKITATLAGSAVGAIIAALIVEWSWYMLFIAFFSLLGVMILAVLTIAVIVEDRNKKKKQQRYSQPANWGFDKTFED